jgi:hypothetical protein
VKKGWILEYHKALCWLQLKDHWPVIKKEELPLPTDPLDILNLENLNRLASPLAPYRNTWLKTLKKASQQQANTEFTKWLDKTDHRAHSYKTETCSGLPEVPLITTKATWLSLQQPVPVQQRLLQRSALATCLETHTPSARRGLREEDYEESFCPLCLTLDSTYTPDESQEIMAHSLWECEHLRTEQVNLALHATQFVLDKGGIPTSDNLAASLQWPDLSRESKMGLLMGNHRNKLYQQRLHRDTDLAGRLSTGC